MKKNYYFEGEEFNSLRSYVAADILCPNCNIRAMIWIEKGVPKSGMKCEGKCWCCKNVMIHHFP